MSDFIIPVEETAGQLHLHAPAPLDYKQRVATLAEAQANAYDGYQTYVVETGEFIAFKMSGGELVQSSVAGGGGATTKDIIADVAAGSVKIGDLIPIGTDITALAEQIFCGTQYPTFVAPTLDVNIITYAGALPLSVESGVIYTNFDMHAGLDQGYIHGKRVAGVWLSNAVQGVRAGAALSYTYSGMGIPHDSVFFNLQIVDGANTFNATADYAVGPQPLDSKGLPYSTPLAPGTVAKSVTCNGLRAHFYGTYADTDAVDAVRIRALAGKGTGAANGTSFNIIIPAGAKQVIFTYSATLRTVSSVKHVEGLGAEVKGVFTETAVSVPGANSYAPISYRLYIYTPAVAFSSAQTYNVTI